MICYLLESNFYYVIISDYFCTRFEMRKIKEKKSYYLDMITIRHLKRFCILIWNDKPECKY